MAQEKIKKGFFFYFGMFVLFLLTVFLVLLVIMMFNPGKTILWMKYFTGEANYISVSKITDGTEAGNNISWNLEQNVVIYCNYATVKVQSNDDSTFQNSGLYIKNNAKGFMGANNSDFQFKVYRGNSELRVELTEPQGFLFFSKDIEIVLHAKSAGDFSNMNLSIISNDGNVELGSLKNNVVAQNVVLNSLSVETTNGKVFFTENFATTNLNSLSIKTKNGAISSNKTISYVDNNGISCSGKGIETNCDTNLAVNDRGTIDLQAVNVGSNALSLTCQRGALDIDYIKASAVKVKSIEGNHLFGHINGHLSYTNSSDSILAPNILVDNLKGDFNLSTDGSLKAEPRIEINKMQGAVGVVADKGRLLIHELKQSVGVAGVSIDGDSMNVNITFAKEFDQTINIVNTSGNVSLNFKGNIPQGANLTTKSGAIEIYVVDTAKFIANMFKNDGTTILPDEKIKLEIGNDMISSALKNPLVINNGSNVISILTDGTVKIGLLKEVA